MLAVSVFHFVAIIFLDIEALILDLPSKATSFVGDVLNIVSVYMKIRQPHEVGRPFIFRGFFAEDCTWSELGYG